MYCLGTAPPKILSTNANSLPSYNGSTWILTWPYWPWPPLCFLYLDSVSAEPLIVSRYGIYGVTSLACTPYLRSILLRICSRCTSPIQSICNWRASAFFTTTQVGSSSATLRTALANFSSSPFFTGSIATVYRGWGKRIASYVTLKSGAVNVSPVLALANFGITTISPALAADTGICCFPIRVTILPHFSSTPWFTSKRRSPSFNSPEKIRTKLCLPANGSNNVLNTNAVNGLSTCTTHCSPVSASVAVITFLVASGM